MHPPAARDKHEDQRVGQHAGQQHAMSMRASTRAGTRISTRYIRAGTLPAHTCCTCAWVNVSADSASLSMCGVWIVSKPHGVSSCAHGAGRRGAGAHPRREPTVRAACAGIQCARSCPATCRGRADVPSARPPRGLRACLHACALACVRHVKAGVDGPRVRPDSRAHYAKQSKAKLSKAGTRFHAAADAMAGLVPRLPRRPA